MKNKIITILALCLTAFSCKKADNKTVQQNQQTQLQTTASTIGLQFDHTYNWVNISGSVSPLLKTYIIFHLDSSITEYYYNDTFTYKIGYSVSSNNSTSILENGLEMKVFILNYVWDTLPNTFYSLAGGYNNDTTTIGLYENTPIAQNNKNTLGGIFPVWKQQYYYLIP